MEILILSGLWPPFTFMSTCTQVVSNDNGILFEHIILPITHIAEYHSSST